MIFSLFHERRFLSCFMFSAKALKLISDVFQQNQSTSITSEQITSFFSDDSITSSEDKGKFIQQVFEACHQAITMNPLDTIEDFSKQNLFFKAFLDYSNDAQYFPMFIELFAKCTSTCGIGFDLFQNLADYMKNKLGLNDQELFDYLITCIFEESIDMSIPHLIKNTYPIPMIFSVYHYQKDKLIEFIEFISKCMDLDYNCYYLISTSNLSSIILNVIGEYRTKPEIDHLFNALVQLFEKISKFSLKSKDLYKLFRICTSLPNHCRPCYTVPIIQSLMNIFATPIENNIGFFDLQKPDDYLQLPAVSKEIINESFSIILDIKFPNAQRSGNLFECSNPISNITISLNNGKIIYSTLLNGKRMTTLVPDKLPSNKWVLVIFSINKNSFNVFWEGQTVSSTIERVIFKQPFTHFKAIRNLKCSIHTIMLIKSPFTSSSAQIFSSIPRFPLISFHSSESSRFKSKFKTLFSSDFCNNIYFYFNASVYYKQNAINLKGSSTLKVFGTIYPPSSRPSIVLNHIGGVPALLPFFAQIEQPIINKDGNPSYDFDSNFMIYLINLLAMILNDSVVHQTDFYAQHGVEILSFLFEIAGPKNITRQVVKSLCALYRNVYHKLAIEMIESIFFNLSIWLYLPIEDQKVIYKDIQNVLLYRYKQNPEETSNSINITIILMLIKCYLWVVNANSSYCFCSEPKENIRDHSIDGKRPVDLTEIRYSFWNFAKQISDIQTNERDISFLISYICDSSDTKITSEALTFLIYMFQKKNLVLLKYIRAKEIFYQKFFKLLEINSPDITFKIIQILILIIRVTPDILNSELLTYFITQIICIINTESITLDHVKMVYDCMVDRIVVNSQNGSSQLVFKWPELIPLFLLMILNLEEQKMLYYFVLIEDLLKMSSISIIEKVVEFRFAYVVFLIHLLPSASSQLSELSTHAIELLVYLHIKLMHGEMNKLSLCELPTIINLISSVLSIDCSHIIRMIYLEFLRVEDPIIHSRSQISLEIFAEVYTQIALFIFTIPNYDQLYSIPTAINKPQIHKDYSFQEMIKNLFNEIPFTKVDLKFTPGTRSTFDGKWMDSQLAMVLIENILNRPNLLDIKVENDFHPLEIVALVVGTGIQHRLYSSSFINFIERINTHIPTNNSCQGHFKNAALEILGSLVRTREISQVGKKFFQIIYEMTIMFQKVIILTFKVKIPRIKSITNFEADVPLGTDHFLLPIVEFANDFEIEAIEKFNSYLEVLDHQIDEINRKCMLIKSSSAATSSSKTNYMPDEDFIRLSLEPFASVIKTKHHKAKSYYRELFRQLSSDNRPWNTPEVKYEYHWKLDKSILKDFCRPRMKQNLKYVDHKDASIARDIGNLQNAQQMYQEQLAQQKMTQFRGDMAMICLEDEDDASVKEDKGNIGKNMVFVKCDVKCVSMSGVFVGSLSILKIEKNISIVFESEEKHEKILFNDIKSILHRKYLLIDSAIEIFTKTKRAFFFDFNEGQREIFLEKIRKMNEKIKSIKFIQLHAGDIYQLINETTEKWVNGKLSNFSFLMKLNKFAGRTYNDLAQYPVFPWIISDYTSDELDLHNINSYRDLTKCIGALCPERVKSLREKMEDSPTDEMKYMYGSLYSSAAVVVGYMIRTEPFTSLHINLQSGRFDIADRLFVSIPKAFESVSTNMMDFRELIPEFFYMPDFLMNTNHFDLGSLYVSKEKVNDVELPPWAKGDPFAFININREALESPLVSVNLPHWINLIFGPKSRPPLNEEADNVFHPYFFNYSIKNADENELMIIKQYAACFGSAPSQIFFDTPPFRKISPLPFHHCMLNFESSFERLEPLFSTGNGIAYLNCEEGVVIILSLDRKYYIYDGQLTTGTLVTDIPNEMEEIARKEQLMAICSKTSLITFPWDTALNIYNMNKGDKGEKYPNLVYRIHSQKVTECFTYKNYFATGSEDCTLRVWKFGRKGYKQVVFLSKHMKPVLLIRLSPKVDICASISSDGLLVVSSLLTGCYIRSYQIKNTNPTHLLITESGRIIVVFNHVNECVYKVFDQNLNKLKEISSDLIIKCCETISWSDGSEYLVSVTQTRNIKAYKLPYLEDHEIKRVLPFEATHIVYSKEHSSFYFGTTEGDIYRFSIDLQ